MKVFISWSGTRSRIVAEALRDWLPNVINAVEPFVSEEDIDKGAVGTEVIARQLHDSTFGIVCLTRDNQSRPWINYEAGALSKVVGDIEARVATVLVDIDSPAGVTGPLSAFQATRIHDRGQMKQLVRSLAKASGDTRSKEALDEFVDLVWNNFAARVTEERLAASGEMSAAPVRQPEEMFGELLTLMRQVSQDVSRLVPRSTGPDLNDGSGRSLHPAIKTGESIINELSKAGMQGHEDYQITILELNPPRLELKLYRRVSAELMTKLRVFAVDNLTALQMSEEIRE